MLTRASLKNPYAVFALCMVFILALPHIEPTAAADESRWEMVRAGGRYILRNRLLLGAVSLDLFAVILSGATALLPVFARDILQADATGLGVLRSATAVGASGGVAPRRRTSTRVAPAAAARAGTPTTIAVRRSLSTPTVSQAGARLGTLGSAAGDRGARRPGSGGPAPQALHAADGTVARLRQHVAHLVDLQVALVIHGCGPQELVEPHVHRLDLGGTRRGHVVGIGVASGGHAGTQVRDEPRPTTTSAARGARDQHHRSSSDEGNEGPHEHSQHGSSMRAGSGPTGRDPRRLPEPHTTFTLPRPPGAPRPGAIPPGVRPRRPRASAD